MDLASDDGSDTEGLDVTASNSFSRNLSSTMPGGFPLAVNILKPQIDKIFADVQKNLPGIDFDSSDVSSDNDEPIFFHHSLKLGNFSSQFDDDKDLDTSLSGTDSPVTGFQNNGSSMSSLITPSRTGLFSDIDNLADQDSESFVYDNDLAALLSKTQFPSDEKIKEWRTLAKKMEEDEQEDARQGNQDLIRSQQLGHFTDTPGDRDDGLDATVINLTLSDDSRMDRIEECADVISKFKSRLKEDAKIFDQKERHRMLVEQARSKDEEIVSKFTPEEPTTLSMRLFQDIDLDSVLHHANEEHIPLSSLRVVGNPTVNQLPAAHIGAGDEASATDAQEELTLIQKLAQLSLVQSGSALAQGLKEIKTSFDPHTGAIVKTTKEDLDKSSDNILLQRQPEEEQKSQQTASKSTGTSFTCSAGTSTSSLSADGGKILYGRPPIQTDKTEPATVFIDLRGFEQHKEEEKMGLQSVQRVLGLNAEQQEDDDDESSSDEEMVERCDWRQTRQKIKEDLSSMGAVATLRGTGSTSNGKSAKQTHKKPPRVINLQEHSISSKWSSSQSSISRTNSRSEGGETVMEEVEGERGGVDVPVDNRVEEDNREKVARQEVEKEKLRQREEARKLREAREKERDARVRMSKHIEAARSTASTKGTQRAAENTPSIFDFEASYEPAPSTLPTVLSPDRETVLLTIQLSSNGEIVQHRTKGNRSVDTGEGLSATYTALLSWLLSLVPHDFDFLGKLKNSSSSSSSSKNSSSSSSSSSSTSSPMNSVSTGFHVIGLQQLWYEEQLRLCVVVTPSHQFLEETPKHSRSKKSKKDDMKNSSRFVQHITKFLTVNTLHSVCPWIDMLVSVPVTAQRAEEKGATSYNYEPPLPKISTKPLSTFVQVSLVTQAARDLFNVPVGLFWQTVDNDEMCYSVDCHDEDVCFETQNTLSLVYKKIFRNPLSLMAILNRVSQEGLDLAGVRLIYPCAGMVDMPNQQQQQQKQQQQQLQQKDKSRQQKHSDLELLNNIGPIFAISLRGTFARSIWLEAIGPSDPQLARRTDPNSLCALYGGDSRDSTLLFCPRNPSRVQSELSRWFGGRILKGAVSIDVGIPYRPKDETKPIKKGKRSNANNRDCEFEACIQRPPAALTATSKSDIFIILSPMVPFSYSGILMATSQRRGYQTRGVKRLLLTAKVANGLGVSLSHHGYFCPGARTEDIDQDHPVDAIAPSTVLLLRKENAVHNTASLIEAFMVQMTLAGLLGCVQMRLSEPLTSKHLFHAATYSDGLMALLGGNFGKTPEFDLTHLSLQSHTNVTVRKDLEQMSVVIILGHEALKKSGLFVGKILNFLPYSKTPLQTVLSQRLELLGIKWVASLSIYQAKELTPFEVGDHRWRPSVKMLESEPALALVVRGVNVFHVLKPLLEDQETLESGGRGFHSSSLASNKGTKKTTYLMSHNPSQTEVFARLFFNSRDLYPDPLARSLLPYMPEFHLYFNILKHTKDNGDVKRLFSLKPVEELNLTVERVFDEMKYGQEVITSCLLVKPMAVKKHMAKILRRIAQEGFQVVGMRLLMLNSTAMTVRFMPSCSTIKGEDTERSAFEKHQEALTSGPSLALALQQHNAVKKLCDLIGPEEPMAARRQSQFLWRGEFGSDIYNNAFYCSPYYVDAVRDIKQLFPDGLCCDNSQTLHNEEILAPAVDSIISLHSSKTRCLSLCQSGTDCGGNRAVNDVHSLLVQTNCLILTPPLMKWKSQSQHTKAGIDIINTLISHGFEPVALRMIWLTQKQGECMLSLIGSGSFQEVAMLCKGPCMVLAIQRDNAVLSFDSIFLQNSQSSKLMSDFGHLIFRGTTVKQSHSLLTFFFEEFMPKSQLVIQSKTTS